MSDDWDKVTVLRKARPSMKEMKSKESINQALATGNVDISKKPTAGTNKHTAPPANARAIEEETESFGVKTINPLVAKSIAQARQKLGITQKDLAVKINEKPAVVNEHESGKALPNPAILAKFERALNVKLRGALSSIGQPLK